MQADALLGCAPVQAVNSGFVVPFSPGVPVLRTDGAVEVLGLLVVVFEDWWRGVIIRITIIGKRRKNAKDQRTDE